MLNALPVTFQGAQVVGFREIFRLFSSSTPVPGQPILQIFTSFVVVPGNNEDAKQCPKNYSHNFSASLRFILHFLYHPGKLVKLYSIVLLAAPSAGSDKV
jgi:hypothetical protein